MFYGFLRIHVVLYIPFLVSFNDSAQSQLYMYMNIQIMDGPTREENHYISISFINKLKLQN